MYPNNLYPGVLVVIEGINGSGKTTIISKLLERFADTPVSYYKFPDRSGRCGSRIDQYLNGELAIPYKYDVLDMFAANRKEAASNIRRDLIMGKLVICDRYFFSAIAYHIPLAVTNKRIIQRYCDVIGYFDKGMPFPDLVYLVDGYHLNKREGILSREVYHYHGTKAYQQRTMLYNVIACYTMINILNNRTGMLPHVVNTLAASINDYRRGR